MPLMVMLRLSATVLLKTRRPLCASVRPSLRVRGLNHTAVRSTTFFRNGVRLTAPMSANRVPITRSTCSALSRSIMRTTSLTRCWPSASKVANTWAPG